MSSDWAIIPFTYVPPPPPPKAEEAPATGGDGAATTNAVNADGGEEDKIGELWEKVVDLELYFQVLIIVGIVLVLLGMIMMCCSCRNKEIKDENKIMAKPLPSDSNKPTNKMDVDVEKQS